MHLLALLFSVLQKLTYSLSILTALVVCVNWSDMFLFQPFNKGILTEQEYKTYKFYSFKIGII